MAHLQRRDQHARARHSDGLRLLERGRRFRDQSAADRLFRRVDLWARVLGRAPQHRCSSPSSAFRWRRRSASSSASRVFRPTGCCRESRWSTSSVMRNTPLLLQLLFWYNAVLKSLPGPRQSLSVGGVVFLNNRGLYARARRARSRPLWLARCPVGSPSRWPFALGAPAPGSDRGAVADRASSPCACLGLPCSPIAAWPARRSLRSCASLRLQSERRRAGHPGNGGAGVRAGDFYRRRSSPRSFAPACWRCRTARARPRARWVCIAACR